ncbi:hypothetical protein S83_053283 [Arachis hypogaea]
MHTSPSQSAYQPRHVDDPSSGSSSTVDYAALREQMSTHQPNPDPQLGRAQRDIRLLACDTGGCLDPRPHGRCPQRGDSISTIALSCCKQEVLFLDKEIAFNEAIIEEGSKAFKKFSDKLNFSCDLVPRIYIFLDDIGSNIEHSHAATAQTRWQLAKASKIQRSNSSLVIYIV